MGRACLTALLAAVALSAPAAVQFELQNSGTTTALADDVNTFTLVATNTGSQAIDLAGITLGLQVLPQGLAIGSATITGVAAGPNGPVCAGTADRRPSDRRGRSALRLHRVAEAPACGMPAACATAGLTFAPSPPSPRRLRLAVAMRYARRATRGEGHTGWPSASPRLPGHR